MASYIYDHPEVQTALLKKLKGRSPFKLNVYIDSQQLKETSSRYSKSRLKELRSCGERCTVFLGKGRTGRGSYHCKGVVVDRRYLFSGGANLTYASRHFNEEFCYKMVGPVVRQVLERLAGHRSKYEVWGGK